MTELPFTKIMNSNNSPFSENHESFEGRLAETTNLFILIFWTTL